jgi:hypothetical protein
MGEVLSSRRSHCVSMTGKWTIPVPCYGALVAQASQHLWLAAFHDVYRAFTCVHHTIHPAPSPRDARRYTVPSRFGRQSGDCGYRVRRLCTGRDLPAPLRRILLMEQQVWSVPDHQPCDLVSQIHLRRDSLSSITYSEELISATISATLRSTDRHHGIMGQERWHFPRDS